MTGTVLLTGASGFVGRHLAHALHGSGWTVRAAVRDLASVSGLPVNAVKIGDLSGAVEWSEALNGATHVVHAAGLAHAGLSKSRPGLPEAAYTQVNTKATLALAQAAQAVGVQRFVYLSSIKAQIGAARADIVTDADLPQPDDAYGHSKLAAEHALAGLDLDWVALRPVLVYGPGVKANMAALVKLAKLPVSLPFGGLQARRSLLSVDNLTSAVQFALEPRCPAGRAYIVSDAETVTLGEMISALRAGLGRKPGLFSVSPALLHKLAALAGQGEQAEKLLGGLAAPPTGLMQAGWVPTVSTQDGLKQLAAHNDSA